MMSGLVLAGIPTAAATLLLGFLVYLRGIAPLSVRSEAMGALPLLTVTLLLGVSSYGVSTYYEVAPETIKVMKETLGRPALVWFYAAIVISSLTALRIPRFVLYALAKGPGRRAAQGRGEARAAAIARAKALASAKAGGGAAPQRELTPSEGVVLRFKRCMAAMLALCVLSFALEQGGELDPVSTGVTGFLALGCALYAWRCAIFLLETDPLNLRAHFEPERVGELMLWGGVVGLLALAQLLRAGTLSEQYHLNVVPALWLTAMTGLGTSATAFWGLVCELARRELDRRQQLHQKRSRLAIIGRVQARIAAEQAEARALSLARRLERAVQLPHCQTRVEFAQMLLLGAQCVRALPQAMAARADITDEVRDETLRELEVFLESMETLPDSAIDFAKRWLIDRSVLILAAAGVPDIEGRGARSSGGTSAPVQSSGELRGIATCTGWRGLLQRLTGLDAMTGPRNGAAFATHLIVVSLLVLMLYELPANGLSFFEALGAMSLPLVIAVCVDMWVSRDARATAATLLSHAVASVALNSLLLAWWREQTALTHDHALPAMVLIGALAILPGWWLGWWFVRRRAPYPPLVPPMSTGPSLLAYADNWRGPWMRSAWQRWLEMDFSEWLNRTRRSLETWLVPASQIDAVTGVLVRDFEHSQGVSDDPQALLTLASAISALEALLQWKKAIDASRDLMLALGDKDLIEEHGNQIGPLWAQAGSLFTDWLEVHDAPSRGGEVKVGQLLADKALASGDLYPPLSSRGLA